MVGKWIDFCEDHGYRAEADALKSSLKELELEIAKLNG
jgi:hypothetical protein